MCIDIKKAALLSTLGLSTLMIPVVSQASSAYANASLNWDSMEFFSFSLDGNPSPSIQWLSQTEGGILNTSDSYAGADSSESSSYSYNKSNWLSDNHRYSSLTYSSSEFHTHAQTAAASSSSPVETGYYSNSSSSSLSRDGQFVVSGSGIVGFKFTASASTSIDIVSWGDSGSAESHASVTLSNALGSSNQSLNSYSYWWETNDLSNTLVVALFYNDGETGYLDTDVSAYTYLSGYSYGDGETPSVPVPGAVWFFGTALIGLVASKRKAV